MRIKFGQTGVFVLRHQSQHGAHAEFALVHGARVYHGAKHIQGPLVHMGHHLGNVAQRKLMRLDHLQQRVSSRMGVATRGVVFE